MNNKLNLLTILLIFIMPVLLYTALKSPEQNTQGNAAIAANLPKVIDFSSTMCMECKELKKTLDVVEPKYENKIIFEKVNVNSGDSFSSGKVQKYGVRVVPTLIFLDKKGNVVRKTEGSMPQSQLEKYLKELLNG